MELELQRRPAASDAILGELEVNGEYECLTLERAAVAIPAGAFRVTLFLSPHFHRLVPRLWNVPDRDAIEMHIGNFPRDTRGCILVGTYEQPGCVLGSEWAFTPLVDKIAAALARQEDVWLTIRNPAPNPPTT